LGLPRQFGVGELCHVGLDDARPFPHLANLLARRCCPRGRGRLPSWLTSRSGPRARTWRRSGARRRQALPPLACAEANLLRDFRRRAAGEDAARGGLVFVCRNALAS
jgi:hypothetical protein